ncbi:hypothetical protein LPJ61_006415, partial [Coemansia biformis]
MSLTAKVHIYDGGFFSADKCNFTITIVNSDTYVAILSKIMNYMTTEIPTFIRRINKDPVVIYWSIA